QGRPQAATNRAAAAAGWRGGDLDRSRLLDGQAVTVGGRSAPMGIAARRALAGFLFGVLFSTLLPANGAFAELLLDFPNVALTGRVTSSQEGAIEGVLVSAQRTGSPISVTVVTNEAGRYSFPVDRLTPGNYALRIRAIGYEFAGPAAVDVAAKGTVTADLALRNVDDISSQLTSTEWLISMPGAEQKRPLIECMS